MTRFVVHWVSKKHWSKPGFDYDSSDFPSVARRAKTFDEAVALAKGQIEIGAALRKHVEIFGLDRDGCTVSSHWLNEDGTIGGMDMDG